MRSSKETKEWNFPDVNHFVEGEAGIYTVNSQVQEYENRIDELSERVKEKDARIDYIEGQLSAMKAELTAQKEMEAKLISNLDQCVSQLIQTLTNDSLAMIQKLVKAIIKKELSIDNKAIKSIIEDLCKEINSDGEISVELSKSDYENLRDESMPQNIKLKCNEYLDKSDIFLTSNIGGILFRVNNAIDTILGI